MSVVRLSAVCLVIFVATAGSECFARGAGGAKPRRQNLSPPEQMEPTRIVWEEFSGRDATEQARLVLVAADQKVTEDAAFRRNDVIQMIYKLRLSPQYVVQPDAKEKEKRAEFDALCKAYKVTGLPRVVLLAPDGAVMAVVEVNADSLMNALRALPEQLKQHRREAKAAEEQPKAGEGAPVAPSNPGGEGGETAPKSF